MKAVLAITFVVATLLAAAAQPPPQNQISIPQKCEDVLSIKVCDKFTSMATNLQLKAEVAKEAFLDAVQKGKKTAEDIYKSVETFYLEKVKTKKCEDFVSAETCKKLEVLGEKLAIKAGEVHVFVKKAIIEGKKKATEIYGKVLDYYRNEIKGKSCEELLKSPKVCTSLRKAATALKVKADQLEKIIKDAVVNGYNNVTAVVKRSIQKLKDLAANTKCEDLLNPNLCAALRDYARRAKIAFPKIMSTVRDLLASGVKIAKGFLSFVYKITDAFIDCEHFFTPQSCELLKKKIATVGGTLSDIGRSIREIASKFIKKASDIHKTILEYTKSKLCRYFNIGCPSSDETAVNKRNIMKRSTLTEMLAKYKAMLKEGIAKAKAKLHTSLTHLMNAMKIVDKTVRDIVQKAIEDGKMKYNEIKELLKKLVDTTTGNGNSTDVSKSKRDLREQLKNVLKTAHANMKAVINHLLLVSKDELKKLCTFVHDLLKKLKGDKKSKREIAELEVLESTADALVDETTKKLEEEAEEIVDDLLDNAIMEAEDTSDEMETSMQKRDLTSAVDKIKQFFGKVGDKLKAALGKLRNVSIEDIKNALKNAGAKLIGVAEDVYKKIKEALEKQQSDEFEF